MSNAELVYEDLIARGKGAVNAKRWRAWIHKFEACCGVKDDYNRADVIKYLAALREGGYNQNSINTMIRPLKLLCQIQNWDGKGVFPRLAMPKVRDDEVSRPVLSKEEVGMLIREAKKVCTKHELAYLAAATVYGLRREEIGTLEVFDGVVKIHTVKGGAPAIQLIPDGMKEYFNEYHQVRDTRWMSRVFKRIVRKVGFDLGDGCGWHTIRRALATELVLCDVSMLNILRFMRWADASLKGEFGMLIIYAKREQAKIDDSVFAVHPFLSYWLERTLTKDSEVSYSIRNVNSPKVLLQIQLATDINLHPQISLSNQLLTHN